MLKIYKRLLLCFTIVIFSFVALFINKSLQRENDVFNFLYYSKIKVSVLLYKGDDPYIKGVRESLEKIEANNKEIINFTFYDNSGNQELENQNLEKVLKEGTDLLYINLVDVKNAQQVVDKIKETNTPVIFFNREPNVPENPIKSYSKAFFIGTDAKEAGILQGEIISNEWKNNKLQIDKNYDDTLDYVMLMGEKENIEAIERSKYSISTVREADINVNEVALRVANWDKVTAKNVIELLLFRYGNLIEAIIANNDNMAIGAIEALQAIGYNNGDKTKNILVVGVDGIDKAIELIDKGLMAGTVIQDDYTMAEALYKVGINLVGGKYPLEGTDYTFDETGVSIRIPYKEYKENKN